MANLALVLSVVIAVLVFVAAVQGMALKSSRARIKACEEAFENQKKNLVYVVRHAAELAEIAGDRAEMDRVIGESKSDEEILGIINAVIGVNNGRVQDASEK